MEKRIHAAVLNNPSSKNDLETADVLHNKPLLLLAEDNELSRHTFMDYLEFQGYRLVEARNGHEVIAQNQAHQPDLILMDVQMPGMDGLEAIRQIRAAGYCTPIIALTGMARQDDEQRCLEAGANNYLSKPVRLKQLVEMIEKLLTIDNS